MAEWFYSPYAGKLFREIVHVPEFEKDLKKLTRRFASLEEDLQIFMKVAMNLFHKQKIDNNAIFHIADLSIHSPKIYLNVAKTIVICCGLRCLSFRLVRNLSVLSEGFLTRFACRNDSAGGVHL